MILSRPLAGDSILDGELGAASPIKTMQSHLARMGLPVRVSGVLDEATVNAVNGIFDGWDDVPSKLRTGRLNKHQIAVNIALVTRYVKLAAAGATSYDRLPE